MMNRIIFGIRSLPTSSSWYLIIFHILILLPYLFLLFLLECFIFAFINLGRVFLRCFSFSLRWIILATISMDSILFSLMLLILFTFFLSYTLGLFGLSSIINIHKYFGAQLSWDLVICIFLNLTFSLILLSLKLRNFWIFNRFVYHLILLKWLLDLTTHLFFFFNSLFFSFLLF